MEDLIDTFSSHQVTIQHNTTSAEHPHFSLYKSKPTSSSQEARRKKFLEEQKIKRYDYTSHARRLATNLFQKADKEEDEIEIEDMDCEIKKPPRSYENQLMLSEWLVEVPCDIESEWYLVLCPVGKRCLVVASRGQTKVYAKSGFKVTSFQSLLPGGCKNSGKTANSYCVIDCIYNEIERTYYVLDVMCWNSHPCYDSETEFRFFWKKAKLDEVPEIKNSSKGNLFKFIPLPHFECTAQSIRETLWSSLPFPSKLDGLLFYHKRTHYTCGTTPLVGWLKGYMVPEMLHIDVPEFLSIEKPAAYTCMQQHCPEAFAKHESRKREDEANMQYEEGS